jgi:hypothetical protein
MNRLRADLSTNLRITKRGTASGGRSWISSISSPRLPNRESHLESAPLQLHAGAKMPSISLRMSYMATQSGIPQSELPAA